MKTLFRRIRLPVPLAVLAAACATGCLRTCSTDPPPPEYFTGVHEDATAGRLDGLPRHLAADPCVDPRVDLLPDAGIGWRGGDPDLVLLWGALLRAQCIRPEDYPDADEISLLEWEETGYWTNGIYATQWTTVSKILTQRGLENNRTFSFSNDDFYGSTTVLVARVHSPDGTRRDVDLAANSRSRSPACRSETRASSQSSAARSAPAARASTPTTSRSRATTRSSSSACASPAPRRCRCAPARSAIRGP